MIPTPAARGWHVLASRCEALPRVLAEAASVSLPPLPSTEVLSGRWVVTGTGASEGPSRVLAALLRRQAGRCADFLPLSCFATDAPPSGDVLVVISQGLSPNARLALAAQGRFRAALLVTASGSVPGVQSLAARGLRIAGHPPDDEAGVLLRVQGPAAATVMAFRLAAAVAAALGVPCAQPALEGLPEALSDAPARADAALAKHGIERLLGRIALVTTMDGGDLAHGLRWKWLEGLGLTDPPVWDVLQVAHGPYQQFIHERCTLIALERPDDPDGSALVDRLSRMLHPERHALIRLRALLPGVAAALDHDAQCNRLVLCALESHPRDLVDWPGRGQDEDLYGLGRSSGG